MLYSEKLVSLFQVDFISCNLLNLFAQKANLLESNLLIFSYITCIKIWWEIRIFLKRWQMFLNGQKTVKKIWNLLTITRRILACFHDCRLTWLFSADKLHVLVEMFWWKLELRRFCPFVKFSRRFGKSNTCYIAKS